MSFLDNLNLEQHRAVTHDPSQPLQILAGPGSGKTAVLTARIAHLILHHSHAAGSICAVTFTNKAANEMRERLTKLIGKHLTDEIKLGTFHALCARFLRRHAQLLGIADNFTVCDADESKKTISKFLKEFKKELDSPNINLTEGTVLSHISKAKAKGKTPDNMLAEVQAARLAEVVGEGLPIELRQIIAEIYDKYEKYLRKSNSLDFDDLLIFGVRLFREHPNTALWCRHILVDEFQDTNTIQYELMCTIAARNKCVSIVGDPDQSIYGWRSAEMENLVKMQRDFRSTEQIFLEQNYRSTGAILAFSLAVISQDTERINKSLHTSHPSGSRPVLRAFDSEEAEAAFIAHEIKRTSAYMGGTLNWGDYVILLRFNALSRNVESALQKEGIPCRVLGGHKFFERLEVKDLLAYLQLVDNPSYDPAFTRSSNVPPRGLGDKSLQEIAKRAEDIKVSQLELVERIYDGKITDTKPPVKKKITPFVKTIRTLRALAIEGASPQALITRLLDLIQYQEHLTKSQPDWETRWENVQELITFATDVHSSTLGSDDPVKSEEGEDAPPVITPLRSFLQASMLSSEGDSKQEESTEKVTISTCHSAKGLEWPVVFIPAAEEGVFPFSRTEDVSEERRLLYVACTRAQSLLYVTSATMRKNAGNQRAKSLSPFLLAVYEKNLDLFTSIPAEFNQEGRQAICTVLSRPLPDPADISIRVEELNKTSRYYTLPMEPDGAYLRSANRAARDLRVKQENTGTFESFGRLPNIPAISRIGQVNGNGVVAAPAGFVRVKKEGSFSAWEQPLASTSGGHVRLKVEPSRMQDRMVGNLTRAGPSSSTSPTSGAAVRQVASPSPVLSTPGPSGVLDPEPVDILEIEDEKPFAQSSDQEKNKKRQRPDEIIEIFDDEDITTAGRYPKPRTGSERKAVKTTRIRSASHGMILGPLSPSKSPPKINPIASREPVYRMHPLLMAPLPSSADGVSMQISPAESSMPVTLPNEKPLVSPATNGVVKKRLGMGRVTGGYTNKKFKPMKPS